MKTKAVFSVAFFLTVYCALTAGQCLAAVPPLISYQGVLTQSPGIPQNGEFSMVFSIHSDSSGGDLLWSETQDSVLVTRGLFSVLLGSVNPIPDSTFEEPNRWLEVEVEGSLLLPRRQIVSVGYAFHSRFTDTADYALSAPRDDDWDPDTAGLNIYRLTGNVGIGTPSPQYRLDVAGTGQMTGFNMPTGASNGHVLTSDATGAGTWQVPTGIRGSGTANYIPKFADETSLGNSNIYETGDNVGIGTTDPGWSRLRVTNRGTANNQGINIEIAPVGETSDIDFGLNVDATSTNVTGTSTTYGGLLSVVANGAQDDLGLMRLIYDGGNSTAFYVRGDGNVGIGTNTPDQKLEVDGNAHITGDLTVDGTINPFPFRVYDGGWFDVSDNTNYPVPHNLGTTKLLITIYARNVSSGDNCIVRYMDNDIGGANNGPFLHSISTTQLIIRTQDMSNACFRVANNGHQRADQLRVVALALE